MSTALIGYTGFVGGNLLQQGNFDAIYNSSNINEMMGKKFDIIWCAGVRAVKWWANLHPEEDWKSITSLLSVLDTVQCNIFVLFSTVDVFTLPIGVDEYSVPPREKLHPYGLNRLKIEEFVCNKFQNRTIIRLPGLFGSGLKKNIIYDFLHDKQIDKIHADACFQFYSLDSVYKDSLVALQAGLNLIHFAVEPVSVQEVALKAFGKDFTTRPDGPSVPRYDMQTAHAQVFHKQGRYIQDHDECLNRLALFVKRERI